MHDANIFFFLKKKMMLPSGLEVNLPAPCRVNAEKSELKGQAQTLHDLDLHTAADPASSLATQVLQTTISI